MNVYRSTSRRRPQVVLLWLCASLTPLVSAVGEPEMIVLGMSEGRAKVQIDGKWGYIDRAGELVIAARYDQVFDFQRGLASVWLDGTQRTIDPDGRHVENPVNPTPPHSPLMPFFVVDQDEDRGKARWGYRDSSGDVVIEPQYAWAGWFHEGLARFMGEENDGHEVGGFLSYDGRVAVHIDAFYASDFSEGKVATLFDDGRYRFLDRGGRRAFDRDFRFAFDFSEGVAAVDTHPDPQPPGINRVGSGRWMFIDHRGEPALPGTFDEVRSFLRGVAPVSVDHRWGLIDRNGRFVVPPRYLQVNYPDANGLVLVRPEGPPSRFAFLDLRGNTVIGPLEGHAQGFVEGLCAFSVYDPETQTTRAGYLGLSGDVVIPTDFTRTESFREGVGRVHTADGTGYIRRDGSWLWKPTR